MNDEKKPRRSAKEIAQAHADRATAKVEKHQAKIEKAEARYEKANADLVTLKEERAALVQEADYRQAHPLLQQSETVSDDSQAILGFDDGDDNPFV